MTNKHVPRPTASVASRAGATDFARKSDLCAKVLAEARRLSRIGVTGSPLHQLAQRATELLEEMDEILALLQPADGAAGIAVSAALHRELDFVQAAIGQQHAAEEADSPASLRG